MAEQNVLLSSGELPEALQDFFGIILTVSAATAATLEDKEVYLVGELASLASEVLELAARVYLIRDVCSGRPSGLRLTEIGLGRVPLLVHGVGVWYPQFFEDADLFQRVAGEHEFQSLTESTKPGAAHRKGLYLTPVTREADGLRFRLLRCSSNFSGPSEDFGRTDREIVEQLNSAAAAIFRNAAPLNHVLAQIYYNRRENGKEVKAGIKAHSDKTKDMPRNGLMAFCTFYDDVTQLKPLGRFDLGVKGKSAMSLLRFRLKGGAEQFDVKLYPNSVFLMPLSTNRTYTHEIRPAPLNAELLPTRMGYVVRCSATEALHRGGATFFAGDGEWRALQEATPQGLDELRRLYFEENFTAAHINYGPIAFSMNQGDYTCPHIRP